MQDSLGRFILILAMPTETQNQQSYSEENYIKQIFRKEISMKNALSSAVVIGNCNLQ